MRLDTTRAAIITIFAVLVFLSWSAIALIPNFHTARALPRPSEIVSVSPYTLATLSLQEVPELLGFVALWTVGIAAMMFPSEVPVVIGYATLTRSKTKGHGGSIVEQPNLPMVSLFVSTYLGVWAVTAVPTFLFVHSVSRLSFADLVSSPTFVGLLLIAAGVYQISSLKTLCLSQCRSPLSFLINSYKPGYRGAVSMGFKHGAYCLGCCWALMLLLPLAGARGLIWMGLLGTVIFVERVTAQGVILATALGVTLLTMGVLILIFPRAALLVPAGL